MKRILQTLILTFVLTLSTTTMAGIASYYGSKFHGKRTASGSIYNMHALTAAHKTLPFGSKVRVTNLKNNKTVDVKITDRGPFIKGRVIDLSKKANEIIGCDLCKVDVKVLSRGDNKYRRE